MVLAHAGGGAGGVHVEFLVISVTLVVFAVVLYFQENVRTSSSIILAVVGLGLGAGAFVFSSDGTDVSNVRMSIVSPDDGANVPAGEPIDVEVELQGATTEPTSATGDEIVGHIHVFVDGQLLQMPTSTSTELELEPGAHALAVEFVGDDHASFEPRVIEVVEVTAQ